jgi:diaminopimelate epimerase
MHGAGNDFVVIAPLERSADWPQLAIAMCDRHRGIGADGVLLLLPSKVADFRMRIFNADGSEAAACGNGTRCLVKHYLDRNTHVPRDRQITVETASGVIDAWLVDERDGTSVRLRMGRPVIGQEGERFQGATTPDRHSTLQRDISVSGKVLALDLLSLGNPHAVHFTLLPVEEFPLAEFGTTLQRHAEFPEGVNFEVARVTGDRSIEARVWEHGVGETLACGSGACAIAVAAGLHGFVDSAVLVTLPGGQLEVEWDRSGDVYLTGPAKTVFEGEWPDTGSFVRQDDNS